MATIIGTEGSDNLRGTPGDDFINALGGVVDQIAGNGGNDTIFGGGGLDIVSQDIVFDGADIVDLGPDSDVVFFQNRSGVNEVRLTFTPSEVANGTAGESGALPGQDGGLAVRVQAETRFIDELTGPVSRYDDEGIELEAPRLGFRFDVRDLVTGVSFGNYFTNVEFGTIGPDQLGPFGESSPRNYFIMAGAGDDFVDGSVGLDWFGGGSGNDRLDGRENDDRLFGSFGADTLFGGAGNDLLDGEQDNDLLYGFVGNDTIFAGGGDDRLDGEQGNDLLYGFDGLDTLFGGDGNDRLDGEADADWFVRLLR